MVTCTRRLEFDAGHRVPLHASKCKTPHGHRYVVDITCDAPELTAEGFVVDFGVVKQYVGAWIDEFLDHTMILQRDDPFALVMEQFHATHDLRRVFLMDSAPTAENIAKMLFEVAKNLLTHDDEGHPMSYGLRVTSVVVWETPNCRAEYRP